MEGTMTTSDGTLKVLQNAKNRLVTKGWIKFGFFNDAGSACLVGALHGMQRITNMDRIVDYQHNREGIHQAYDFIDEILKEQYNYTGGLMDFNDADERTFDEVIAVLDKAIVKA